MNLSDHLSQFVSYGEAIHSPTADRLGILNIPNEVQLEKMRYVAREIFDKVRIHLNSPLTVSSFFRSPELNAAIGGSSTTSQHMKGEAIDMYKPGRHLEIFNFVRDNLEFDQLISEYGSRYEPSWIHVSKVSYRPNRMQMLRCELVNGKITYTTI